MKKKIEKLTDEQRELVEDNVRLAYWNGRKWFNKKIGYDISYDDFIGDSLFGLVKASKGYDKSKNIKFGTYALRAMENEILMRIRRCKNEHGKGKVYLDDILSSKGEKYNGWEFNIIQSENNIDDWVAQTRISEIIETLPKSQRVIIDLRLKGYKQKQIGEIKKLSQSYVSRILLTSKQKIRKELEK